MALLATAIEVATLSALALPARAAGPLPLPGYDAAAVANPPGTASAGSVPMSGTDGEFSVSDTGTAAYGVPLRVVPGRGGLQPRLSLHYSSEAGDGQVGTGFSLSGFSQLTRCARTVAEDQTADGVLLEDTDRFCLDGRKLVAVAGPYGADGTEYRTQVDSHVRVRSHRTAGALGQGPTHFTVWDADGLVHEYGTGGNAVTVSGGGLLGAARIAWPVTRTTDRSGNLVEYTYGTTEGLFGAERERWPTAIRYGRPGQLDRQVEFTFATRADRRSGFLHGSPRDSTKLLTAVTMSAKPGAAWERARSYTLKYRTSAGGSRASLLESITECGRVAAECARPTVFDWASGTAGFAAGATQTSAGLPLVPTSPDSPLTAADFSGDGRTDLVWPEQDTWRYVYAQSGGYSAPADRAANPVGPKATSYPFDYDVDGRTDLMPRKPQITTYGPILSRGTQPFPSVTTPYYGGFNQVTLGSQLAGGMTGDFDGDGYQDLLEYVKPLGQTGDDLPVSWAWRRRSGTVGPGIDATPPTDSAAFGTKVALPALEGLTPDKVVVIDANGDGRDEIIHPTNNSAASLDPLGRVQPFTYHSIRNALLHLDVKLADVNGDDLTDLLTNGDEVGPKDDGLYVRINTGREFQTPQKLPVSAGNELAAVHILDDDGDGRDDLLVPKHTAVDNYHGMDVIRPTLDAAGLLTFPVSATEIAFHPRKIDQLAVQGPRLADVDGDGRTDVVVVNRGGADPGLRVFRHAGGAAGTGHADLLTAVREGTQAPAGSAAPPPTVAVAYAPLVESPTYQPGSCPRTANQLCVASGARTVVKEVRRDAGVAAAVRVARYMYSTGRMDKASRAFLGFAERRVVEDATGGGHGAVTTRTFYSNSSRLDPRPLEEWSFATLPGGAQSLQRTTVDWGERATAGGASFGYVTARRVRRYEISPGCPSCLASWPRSQLDAAGAQPYAGTLERTTEVDQYGNVTGRSTERFGADQAQPETRTTVTSGFDVDAANWLVRRTRSVVTTDAVRSGSAWTSATRSAENTFLPVSTLVSRTRHFDSAAAPGRVLATELAYDASGDLVRSARVDETTGERREATFGYDPMGHPHAAMNAAGHVARTGHDPVSGQLEVAVDANRLRTEYTYDSLGRQVRTRLPSGAEITTAYALETAGPDLLRRTEVRTGTGAVTQVVADRLGRPVTERFRGFDGAMRQSILRYEPEGRLAERTVPVRVGSAAAPKSTTYGYDDLGRLRSTTDPAGAIRSVAHTGLETVTTDAEGHRSRQVWTANGTMARVVDGLGTAAEVARTYRYGPFGTLLRTEVEGVPASAATYAYDAQGRPVSATDAERGTTTTAYNAFGEVVTTRDADGRETVRVHDALGRLTRSTVTKAGVQRSVLAHQYDTAGARSRAGMLMASTLTDSTGGTAVQTGTEFSYDDLSRVSAVQHRLPGETLAFGYSYDAFGRTTALRYPALPGQAAGAAIAYDYGAAATTSGRLQKVRLTTDPAEELLWAATATDEQDRLSAEQSGDLAATVVTRDEVGRVRSQAVSTATTDQRPALLLLAETYGYDKEGNLTQREKTREGGAQMRETFGYDPLDRVASVTLAHPDPCPAPCPAREDPGVPPPTTPWVSRQVDNWSYDKLGNLTASTRRGTFTHDPARPTQVTAVTGGLFGDRTYRYDAVGNQVERDGRLVAYTDRDLPARITDDRTKTTVASFLYHPGGERARLSTAAGTTTTVPGLYERQVAGTATEHRLLVPVAGRTVATLRYAQTGGAVSKQRSLFLHPDRLGSPALVTADTAAEPKATRAAVQEERSYDAYGAPRDPDWRLDAAGYGTDLAPATVTVGYTGHRDDRELGLVDMTGRVYDPALGRFLTADPKVAGANATQAWNRYAYVSGNPLTSTDPDGHEECFGCTFWDEGGWVPGGGSGGVWGPNGPDAGHGGVDDWIQDGEAYDRGGNGGIDPTRNGSREIQRGIDRHDRGIKEALRNIEIMEAKARYRDALARETARLKALYGESKPQGGSIAPSIPKPGSQATGPNALACNGECPVGGGTTDTKQPYEGGVCADGGTGCFLDGAPTPPAAPAAPGAPPAVTPPAPAAPAGSGLPSWPPKAGDTFFGGEVLAGTGFPPGLQIVGASVAVGPQFAWTGTGPSGGFALSGSAYTAVNGVTATIGYNGYQGFNASFGVRFGSGQFFSWGPDFNWSWNQGYSVGRGISAGAGPVSVGYGY